VFKTIRRRKIGSSEEGSEILEFALVATVLLTMIFGIIDFSRCMYAYHWVSYAATQATRYASVHGNSVTNTCSNTSPWVDNGSCQISCSSSVTTTGNVTNYVTALAIGLYLNGSTTQSGGLKVSTSCPGTNGSPKGCVTTSGANTPGCPVNVSVQYIYGFTLPFVSKEISTITLKSTSQVIIAY
jgi:Flp pilus assembly protein TadG